MDGPELPIEFARVSRDGRLTLVLTAGTPAVPALWTELDYTKPLHAQEALAGREGCMVSAVGLWPGKPPEHNAGADAIAAWASERGMAAVVWTALKPKFNNVDGLGPQSAAEAVNYLEQLAETARSIAKEYVERAPPQVRTPFRSAFEQDLGWHPQPAATKDT